MVISLTRDVSRTLRYALNPRTRKLPAGVIKRLLKIVFVAGGLDPVEASIRLGRAEHIRSTSLKGVYIANEIDWELGIDRKASTERLQKAEDLCRLIYIADTSKTKPDPDRVVMLVVEALVKEPLAGFECRALQSRYAYVWIKQMLDVRHGAWHEECPKALIRQILKVSQVSPTARSRALFALAVQFQLRLLPGAPLPVFKQVVDSLPYPVTTVLTERLAADDDKARILNKYRILEFPLPLATPRRSPAEIVETLLKEFPWMIEAIASIEIDLLLGHHYRKGATTLNPKLLVGEPGCGKTTFAGRVAELLGQPKVFLSAAGADSSRLLLGIPRPWDNARPCFVVEMILSLGIPNITVCVDELDKESTSDRHGRFSSALLGFLEPTSSRRYFDECLFVHCDFRSTSWIATANDPRRIPAPVLSRFTLIDCPQPAPVHMPLIAENVVRGLRKEYRLRDDLEVLDDRAQAELGAQLRQVRSAREVTHLVRTKFGETLRRRFSESTRLPSSGLPAQPVLH